MHATDPVTPRVFRFGTGFLILLPIALFMKSRWPKGRDWVAVVTLGILFFFAFSVLFNLAYTYTTAARGALTLSTMPLMTMLVGAALGIETLTVRKTAGVLVAMAGVLFALAFGLSNAPAGAWRGELVMFALPRVHVALRVVAPVHCTVRSACIPDRRHGRGGVLPAGLGAGDPWLRRRCTIRHTAMAGDRRSRNYRKRRCIYFLGICAFTHQSDKDRGHHHGEPGICV